MVRFVIVAFAVLFWAEQSAPVQAAQGGPVLRSGTVRVTAKIVRRGAYTTPLVCQATIAQQSFARPVPVPTAAPEATAIQYAMLQQRISVLRAPNAAGVCVIDLPFDKWAMYPDVGQQVELTVTNASAVMTEPRAVGYNSSWVKMVPVPEGNRDVLSVDFGNVVVK